MSSWTWIWIVAIVLIVVWIIRRVIRYRREQAAVDRFVEQIVKRELNRHAKRGR